MVFVSELLKFGILHMKKNYMQLLSYYVPKIIDVTIAYEYRHIQHIPLFHDLTLNNG